MGVLLKQRPTSLKLPISSAMLALGLPLMATADIGGEAAQRAIPAPDRFKILLQAPGIYEVTFADLERAGFRGTSLPSREVAISHLGEEVHSLLRDGGDGRFEEGDSILFRGEHLAGDISYLNEHSDTNVYWLTVGEGTGAARYQAVDPTGEACPPGSPASTSQHLERDLLRVRFSARAETRQESWFWHKLSQIDEVPFEQELDLGDLLPGSAEPVRLKIHLRGWSRFGGSARKLGEDHAVEVLWGRPSSGRSHLEQPRRRTGSRPRNPPCGAAGPWSPSGDGTGGAPGLGGVQGPAGGRGAGQLDRGELSPAAPYRGRPASPGASVRRRGAVPGAHHGHRLPGGLFRRRAVVVRVAFGAGSPPRLTGGCGQWPAAPGCAPRGWCWILPPTCGIPSSRRTT